MSTPRLVSILTLAVAAIVQAQTPYVQRQPTERSALAPLPDNSRIPLYGGSPQATPTPNPTPKLPEKEKPAYNGQPIIIINNNGGGPYGGYYPPVQSSGFSSSFSTPGWVSGNYSMPPWNSTVTAWSSGPAYGTSYGQQPSYGYPNHGNHNGYVNYGNNNGYVNYGNQAPVYPTYIPGPSVQGYRGAAGQGFGNHCSPGTTIGGGGITFTWRGR